MLRIKDLSFDYPGRTVLKGFSLKVRKGEHLALMGESGCGKSTLLKLIYGILPPKGGRIHWDDTPLLGPDYNLLPGAPFMKYLSQDFDLMPYTTVAENISEFLSFDDPDYRRGRTLDLVRMIEMEDYLQVKVRDLSGGQQQRVALARVLAQKPELLLLDEPFSHIDNFRRSSLRRNLYHYLERNQIACITATHDKEDVLPFADRVVVLQEGEIVANKPTLELYEQPGSLYVANLFGEANRIPIEIVKSYADTRRKIIVYAHEFAVSDKSGIPVQVTRTYPMGSYFLVRGQAGNEVLFFHSATPLEADKVVYLNISLKTINQRLKH